jgi:AAA domain
VVVVRADKPIPWIDLDHTLQLAFAQHVTDFLGSETDPVDVWNEMEDQREWIRKATHPDAARGEFEAEAARVKAAVDQATDAAFDALARERQAAQGGDDDDGPRAKVRTLGDLLDTSEAEYDWLVPGLLERGDRLIVTGREGYGKSTLLRQMGVGAGIGVNTLSSDLMGGGHESARVLLIDLENTPRQLRREFAKLLAPLTPDQVRLVKSQLFVESHPEGLVLDLMRDPDGDREWVAEAIGDTKPDLLIIGPVYKMIDGEPNDELPNRNLVKWLDRLRVVHGLTMLLEAHTPHDQKRPYGWSGWKRWPEFGFHLSEDGRLQHWRGQRDERAWPEKLARANGQVGSRQWLWTPDLGNRPEAPSDPHAEGISVCKVEVLRHLNKIDRALTGNELVALIGRRKASVQAAIAQLREDGALVAEPVKVVGSDGKSYPSDGYRTAPRWRAEA